MNNNKFMSLINVLKNKAKRAKDKLKDLEGLINTNAASAVQKQEYVELKAKVETLEDVIDLAEGIIDDK
jgi:hypothetical protein